MRLLENQLPYRHSYALSRPGRFPLYSAAIFVCLLHGAHGWPQTAQSEQSDWSGQAREILRRLSADVHDRPPVMLKFVNSTEVVKDQAGMFRDGMWHQGELRRDADRREVFLDLYRPTEEARNGMLVRRRHILWDGPRGRNLRASLDLPGENRTPGGDYSRFPDWGTKIGPDQTAGFADGELLFAEHFSDTLLRAEEFKASKETDADSGELHRFQGRVPEGRIEVWLTPGDPPVLMKGTFRFSEAYIQQDNQKKNYPGERYNLKSYEITVETHEVDLIDGVAVPVRASRVTAGSFQSPSSAFLVRNTVTRSDIRFNPDFESLGAFRFDLPNGARIFNADVPGTRFTWLNGDLIPWLDPENLRSIEGLVSGATPGSSGVEIHKILPVTQPARGRRQPPAEPGNEPGVAEEPRSAANIGFILILAALGLFVVYVSYARFIRPNR